MPVSARRGRAIVRNAHCRRRLAPAQARHPDAAPARQNVAPGRLSRPRLDLYLFYWLIARLGRQVKLHEVFSSFRDHLDSLDGATQVEALVRDVSKNSLTYSAMMSEPANTDLGRFRYRVLETMQADVFTPLLIWLRDASRPPLPASAFDEALASIESWSVRRMICRLTSKDANKLTLDLIEGLRDEEPANVGVRVRTFLLGQTAESRLWPSDDVVRTALRDGQLYKTLSRARLRMVLESVEDHLRTGYAEQASVFAKCSIEHVLPQSWDAHWPFAEGEDQASREGLVHTLGNLTLVTAALNAAASNKSWADKRAALDKHSVLRINRDLLDSAGDAWSHAQIRTRTEQLTAVVLDIWRR